MGSDGSNFNVSLTEKDKVTKSVHKQLPKREGSRSGVEPRASGLPAERLTARPNRLTPEIGA